jgi:hypothetical protein
MTTRKNGLNLMDSIKSTLAGQSVVFAAEQLLSSYDFRPKVGGT